MRARTVLSLVGNYRRTTTCDKASDCVFLVESKGAFDLQAG